MRSVLDKQMLIPRHVASYTEDFNEVVTDFIERLRQIRKRGNGLAVPNLDHELFHWSLESKWLIQPFISIHVCMHFSV